MGRKKEAKQSGGFFRNLFHCRPQRPDDTGVIFANGGSSNAVIEKKSKKNAAEKKEREVPLILPSPPADEVTPITSNRKPLNHHEDKKANFIPASTHLKQVVAANSSSSNFIDELEASVNEAKKQEKKEGRKSYPSFPNTHPLQENVKAKLEWFETAFASSLNHQDSTENTEDITENSMSETEDFRVLPNSTAPGWEEHVVDCGNDPWERAYAVWYRKGLLKWRPKSVPVENESLANEKSAIYSGEMLVADIATGDSIDLEIVEPKESLAKSAPLEEVANDDVDDAMLLMKYRSKPATACANCGKVTSFTIALVRCVKCKQELYCSVFCRGNDRYNHAVSCCALAWGNPEGPTKRATKKLTVPAVFATEREEGKIEKPKETAVRQAATARSEKDRLVSSNAKVSEMFAVEQVQENNVPKDVAVDPSKVTPVALLKVKTGPRSIPSTPNVALYSDVHQTTSSRSSSLRKSKQVPMVSLFGVDTVKERIATPRRLTTESV